MVRSRISIKGKLIGALQLREFKSYRTNGVCAGRQGSQTPKPENCEKLYIGSKSVTPKRLNSNIEIMKKDTVYPEIDNFGNVGCINQQYTRENIQNKIQRINQIIESLRPEELEDLKNL